MLIFAFLIARRCDEKASDVVWFVCKGLEMKPLFHLSDFVQKIFDAIPAILLIVDSDVRIHHLNAAASHNLGLRIEDVFNKRGGEVMHCIHSTDVPEGCGRAPFCKECIIRNSVDRAFQGGTVYQEKTRMELIRGTERTDIYLLVTASPFDYEDKRFVLLILENISELIRLRGLLPICANCKKIRNDSGYWESLERYLKARIDVDFTHGICEDCARRLYPEYYNG